LITSREKYVFVVSCTPNMASGFMDNPSSGVEQPRREADMKRHYKILGPTE
jgi:hypothetical protein